MGEWKEYKLIDVLDNLIDYRGKTPKKATSGIPLITAKIIKNGRIEKPSEFISIDDYASWMVRGFPKIGDVVLTTEAPMGEVAQLTDDNVALAQRVVTLRGKSGVLDNTYLKYYLMSNVGQQKLKARETGTTVTGIKQSELREILVECPPYYYQVRIASILKSLDDKIENNKRINENLEQQAQALFKSWFVDFEPFRDQPFVDSELGMIPEGWRVVSLDEACIKITDGSHYSPQNSPDGKIPMLSVKDMRHNGFDYSNCKMIDDEEFQIMKNNDCVPMQDDILVAKDGSYLKELFLCRDVIRQAILSSIAIFRCNLNVIYPELLLELLRLPEVRKNVGDNYVSGSALPRIVLKDFKKFKFIVAPLSIQNEMISIFRSLSVKIHKIDQESLRLAQLRDTLLPKLMSGEIQV